MPSSFVPVSLPASANLEHLKKQAKDLLAALRANDPAAHARWHTFHSEPSLLLSSGVVSVASVPSLVSLSHAQFIVAREYGFASWPRLKRHVEAAQAARHATSAHNAAPETVPDADAWDALLRADANLSRLPDVERRRILPIHTAQWRVTTTKYSEEGRGEHAPPTHDLASREYIRLDPPAHARYQDFTNSWSHSVRDERGHLSTGSSWEVCHLRPHRQPFTAGDLLDNVLFLPPANQENATGSLPLPRGMWQSELMEVEGQSLIRWHQETIKDNFRVARSIWTETATHRIQRQERREINLLTGQDACFIVHDRYIYDAPSPESIFEMPPGKPIVTPDTSGLMPEVWDTLPAKQRQSLQKTIDRSDAGWRNADFAAFGAMWTFGSASHLPPESEWRERVQKQAEMWREWNSEILSANAQPFVPVTVAMRSYRWQNIKDGTDVKNEFLRVKVKLRVVRDGDGSVWEGKSEFFLRHKGRNYEIVHWECPWAEIEAERADAERT